MENSTAGDRWIPVDVSNDHDLPEQTDDEVPLLIVWYPTRLMPCFLICAGQEIDYAPESDIVPVTFCLFGYILAGCEGWAFIYE